VSHQKGGDLTTTNPSRDRLATRLSEVLGPEEAITLMGMLPADHDQLATKADIGGLDERVGRLDERVGRLDDRVGQLDERVGQLDERVRRLDDRMERFENRLWDLHMALESQSRTYVVTTVSSLTALTAIYSLIVAFFA